MPAFGLIGRWNLRFVLLLAAALAPLQVLGQEVSGGAALNGPVDPYYPNRNFPKLTTPQWVGEEGVEAVVTLAIDDMRDSAKYEAFLRPILDRLKRIDGRAAVSIMACQVEPNDPQIQAWLKEGVSIECHTFDHPCPCLQGGNFARAKETYEKCVDLVNQIPGNKPVAFRMPCCDSQNTPSPRFWAEVFNKTTAQGNFLQLDSSVFNIITSNDPELPKEITLNEQGEERFRRYVPFKNFVNTIEDYPYPYVIGGMCWEFPCVVPSDWSAQHVQKPNNPDTVRDWKLALDAIVIKKGVFNLVFHPHGWIRAEQIVELIDYAQEKHGKKVKFLTFRECADRLNKNVLGGQPLRAASGAIAERWLTAKELPFPVPTAEHAAGATRSSDTRFVDVNGDGKLDRIISNAERYSLHLYKNEQEGWSIKVIDEVRGMETGNGPVIPPFVRADGTNNGAWFHSQAIWAQNEDTWNLPDGVQKVTFEELLAPLNPSASGERKSSEATPKDGTPREAAPPPADAKQSRASAVMRSVVQTVAAQAGVDAAPEMPPGHSPDEALKLFDPRPGMKVELVAAEPLVVDPVAFDWGPDGRLWVVEMRDYPNGLTWRKPGDKLGEPGGRVKVLTDEDGDGRYDKATVFLEGLSFPTGIKVWRKGALITAAPEILYAEDADGDGRAEIKETLYVGFGTGNQQHRVNGLRWGVDGWLYVGNGDSGGKIKSTKTGQEIEISGRDLRIRPDTGELEAQSGQTQFGRETDDWGNWFGGNNSNPMWHYVIEDHYLKRNRSFAAPDVRRHVAKVPGAAPVFPTSRTLARFNDFHAANRFTSACSPMIYRDDLLGPSFVGNAFICEPVHNLVHREVMERDGATFRSDRAADERESEFLASRDNWFRPVMARTGPDGALWVADMYRMVIEHPEWIPKATQEQIDLRAGEDKGRIWRVTPTDRAPRPFRRLDNLNNDELVAALDTPNGWQRDMAQQLLVWRGATDAADALARLYQTSARPQTRLAAIATLAQLERLSAETLVLALGDEHPEVRRHAVRLCERRSEPALMAKLRTTSDDRDAAVRLQLACSLGEIEQPWVADELARLLLAHPDDAYLFAAVASSLNPARTVQVATSVLKSGQGSSGGKRLEELLRQAILVGDKTQLGSLIAAVATASDQPQTWQLAALGSALGGLNRRGFASLSDVLGQQDRAAVVALLQKTRDLAAGDAFDEKAPDAALRLAAIATLGQIADRRSDDFDILKRLLSAREPIDVQKAAARTLIRCRTKEAADALFESWAALSPATRDDVFDDVLHDAASTARLLQAIEAGVISPAQISPRHRQQLLTVGSPEQRAAAEKLFAGSTNANRRAVLASYASVKPSSDVAAGQAIFKQRCSNCHKLDGQGHAVGPDLAALTNRSPEALLTAILDPNRAVEDKFLDYAVLTTDGRQLSGMLVSETGASVTLAGPEGKQITVLRSEIDELRSTGKSLMPEGLERDIPPQQMAHLLAYLGKLPSQPPKSFPGNAPEVVREDGIGRLILQATAARIYGPAIVLEEKYRNLGYWQDAADHAIWTVAIPAAGRYRAILDYACADNMQGNRFVLQSGSQQLTWKVEGTGSWDNYRGKEIGVLELPEGEVEVVVRSDGAIQGALLDLRSIRLAPVKP